MRVTAKQLREWCDRMGDDAEVCLSLEVFYSENWTTKFAATSDHPITSIHGRGCKGQVGSHSPRIVLSANHSVRMVVQDCPICKESPPRD